MQVFTRRVDKSHQSHQFSLNLTKKNLFAIFSISKVLDLFFCRAWELSANYLWKREAILICCIGLSLKQCWEFILSRCVKCAAQVRNGGSRYRQWQEKEMGECKLGICFSPVTLWRSLSQMSGVKASVSPALSEHVTFPFSLHICDL